MLESPAPLPTPARPAPPPLAPAGLLAEITAGLAAGNGLHELLGRFLQPIVQLAGARGGAVRVLDEADQRLHLVGDLGLPHPVLDAERSVAHDCGVCGAAALGDAPVWTADVSGCAQRSAAAFSGAGFRRVLAVPLHHRARVLGVYSLFFDGGHEPSREVLALLKSVGDLLGLALANAQLERQQLQATLLHERQAMAAEVHDSVAQSLAYVKMRLPLLHDAMLGHDDARALRYFGDIRQAVADAHASLRQVLTSLRTAIDPAGLLHALRGVAAAFESRTGIIFELVDRAGELPMDAERQAQAFQIVQEALANVARHSKARQVRVSVVREGGQVQVQVDDDGSGLPPAPGGEGSAHFGIEIMKARARRLGGSLMLGTRPGGGTRVQLVFPLQPPAPHAGPA